MKQLLIILMVAVVLVSGCIKLGGPRAQTGKGGDQAGIQSQPDTAGLAQNPGGLQSLPDGQSGNSGGLPTLQGGGQSGSLGGFNQPSGSLTGGTLSSPNMAEFPLSGQGGNQSSGMGELQGLQAGGQGGVPGGELPVIQSGGSTGTMSGFKSPPSNSPPMPAGVPVEKLPFFEKDLYADTAIVDVGESVFLGWRVANADEYKLEQDGKVVQTIPRDGVGTFVIPNMPGISKYTLTAKSSGHSVSLSVEVNVLSRGQRAAFDMSKRCRTFMVYPKIINKGEPVYVYWNVLDAQNVYIDNNFTGNSSRVPDARDLMTQTYGMEQYWPYQDTDFRLTHGSGKYSSSTYWTDVCYVDVQ